MSTDQPLAVRALPSKSILWRNLFLTIVFLGCAIYALKLEKDSAAGVCLAFVTGLWMHSGRRRRVELPMGAPPASPAPRPAAVPPPIPPA